MQEVDKDIVTSEKKKCTCSVLTISVHDKVVERARHQLLAVCLGDHVLQVLEYGCDFS